jgi:hypothetical protein
LPIITPVIERLLARVCVDAAGCWIWTGAANMKGGYGVIWVGAGRAPTYTHRIVWEHYNGPIQPAMQIDHLCRTPRCVNPDHLELVTSRENTMRGNRASRPLVCKHGHWLLGENVLSCGTRRDCRTCAKRRSDAFVLRSKES